MAAAARLPSRERQPTGLNGAAAGSQSRSAGPVAECFPQRPRSRRRPASTYARSRAGIVDPANVVRTALQRRGLCRRPTRHHRGDGRGRSKGEPGTCNAAWRHSWHGLLKPTSIKPTGQAVVRWPVCFCRSDAASRLAAYGQKPPIARRAFGSRSVDPTAGGRDIRMAWRRGGQLLTLAITGQD